MDGRRIIEELLPLADDIERRIVAAPLPELDDGFLKATIPTSHAFGAKRSHKNMTTARSRLLVLPNSLEFRPC
jgi:hypothetical protein